MRPARVIRSVIRTCSNCSTRASTFSLRSTSSTSNRAPDTVYQITGAQVRETVPDSVLDLADEIILVDLTPEQLRTRLEEGRVYLGDPRGPRGGGFFQGEQSHRTCARWRCATWPSMWTATCATFMRTQAIAGPVEDRRPGCSSRSARVRFGKAHPTTRAARGDDGGVVDRGEHRHRARARRSRAGAAHALPSRWARQLGAEVISTPGTDIGETLLRLARQHNVTQIVLGKPLEDRWRACWAKARRSMAESARAGDRHPT